MFFVYVLKSSIDDRLYKGFTLDLQKRLKEHNLGKNRSTSAFKPWKIVYYEQVDTRKEARDREKFLKSGIGREYLKNILDL